MALLPRRSRPGAVDIPVGARRRGVLVALALTPGRDARRHERALRSPGAPPGWPRPRAPVPSRPGRIASTFTTDELAELQAAAAAAGLTPAGYLAEAGLATARG